MDEKNENELRTFKAFISYSHRNGLIARRFHRRLENYAVPRRLQRIHKVDKTLHPIFLDRADYRSVGNYHDETRRTLQQSKSLVVICTPDAARSTAVNDEIIEFKRLGREERVLPIIFDGEPNATDRGRIEDECFPPSLRFALGENGLSAEKRINPIAADARPEGDGPSEAFLKIVAGILNLPFDELKRRHIQAARWRAARIGALAAIVMAGVIGGLAANAIVAERSGNMRAARIALDERQFDLAGNLALAAIAPAGSLIHWTPKSLDQIILEAGARASVSARGGGCAPADVAPEQPCFAGDTYLSPDRKVLAVLVSSTVVGIFDTHTGRQIYEILSPGSEIVSLALSRDGRVAAIGKKDGTLTIVQTSDGAVLARAKFEMEFSALRFSSEDSLLFLEGGELLRRVKWVGDQISPEVSFRLPEHISVTVDPTGTWALIRSSDRSVLAGPLNRGGSYRERLIDVQRRYSKWAFSADGQILAIGINDTMGDRLYVVPTETAVALPAMGTRHKIITFVGISDDGSSFLSGGIDGKVRVWKPGQWEPTQTLETPFRRIDWVGMSGKQGMVVAVGDQETGNQPELDIFALKLSQAARRLALRGHTNKIRSAMTVFDGSLITAADDASVRWRKIEEALNLVEAIAAKPAEALSAICADRTGPFSYSLVSGPNSRASRCEGNLLARLMR